MKAVLNPEVAAKKKARKHVKSDDNRKRKASRIRNKYGGKKLKHMAISRD